MRKYSILEDDDDYDDEEMEDEQVYMLRGEGHLDAVEQEEGEPKVALEERAFIVSQESVQIIGYSVEDIIVLAKTSRDILKTLKGAPEKTVGFK